MGSPIHSLTETGTDSKTGGFTIQQEIMKCTSVILLLLGFFLVFVAAEDGQTKWSRMKRQVRDPCRRPCTRELQPVRGVQGGRTTLSPNSCEFKNSQCRASRNRAPPLLLAEDQSNIVWPSI